MKGGKGEKGEKGLYLINLTNAIPTSYLRNN